MLNQFQESCIMYLANSREELQEDLFGQVLDMYNPDLFFERQQQYSSEKKSQFEPNQSIELKIFNQINHQECQKSEIIQGQDKNNNFLYINSQKSSRNQVKIEELDQKLKNTQPQKKLQRMRRTTRCTTKIQQEQVQIMKQQKNSDSIIADYNNTQYQTGPYQSKNTSKKSRKLIKKMCKNIFKQKQFGKTFKISFPKKVVEMFLNHYEKYSIENEKILRYNESLQQKFKSNRKNDYTFEKQVSQILGQTTSKIQYEQVQQYQKSMMQISKMNRRIFSQIVRQTMKQQVIMRDKIAKNRQLYMIQLKVYALRCRSHRLAKKGTFK